MQYKNENIIAKDGGYVSRKLVFAVATSIMILISPLVVPAITLAEVISGLVAVAGIYITGNVITKWRASGIERDKLQITKSTSKAEPKEEDLSD